MPTRLPRLWLPLLVAASTGCSGEAPPDSGEPPGDLPIFARAPVDPPAPSGDDPTEDAAPNPWLVGIPGDDLPEDDPANDPANDPEGNAPEGSGSASGEGPGTDEPEEPPLPPEPARLLLTQMYEGLGNDKALEITNLGTQSVDLARCVLSTYVNGNTSPYRSATLSGTLAHGASVVLCAASASAPLMARCADKSSAIAFNGNDAILLRCDGDLTDSFGRLGEDPGAAWGTSVRTMDANLVRLCDAEPRSTPEDPFEPAEQWRSVSLDDLGDLGAWSCPENPAGDPAELPEGHAPLEPLPALCDPHELLVVPE
ncbi:MAG: hypothetical protein GX607_01610 [Myxococcales bacterium]|nr:hypothetical protein [Myxococcales bacterium]